MHVASHTNPRFLECCSDSAKFVNFSTKVSVVTVPNHRGGFNGRPLVQWPTRPLGGWALEAPGPPEG